MVPSGENWYVMVSVPTIHQGVSNLQTLSVGFDLFWFGSIGTIISTISTEYKDGT